MEWDFRYLQGKYLDAGAREKFEEICLALLMEEYPGQPVHTIRPAQGDGGIDVMIGDYSKPIHVFQCKYFLDRIGKSQKDQIQKSFRTARDNPDFTMEKWTLLIPQDLSQSEMSWWSKWKSEREAPGLTIDYLGQKELLAKLRKHGLYDTYFDDSELKKILQELDEAVQKMEKRLADVNPSWLDASGLQFITAQTVSEAAAACTEREVQEYYRISNRFQTMFRVISADRDVPHGGAMERLGELLEDPAPIIIAGNGGQGKSSLMLRAAILWARRGGLAVWRRLSAGEVLTEAQAEAFVKILKDAVPEGGSLLLCIDNPFEGRASFQALQQVWPTDTPIRLLLAERSNRLAILADPAEDSMQGWFDGARVIELGSGARGGEQFEERNYTYDPMPEEPDRRQLILETAVETFSAPGSLSEEEKQEIVNRALRRRKHPSVRLAELIYRTLFALTQWGPEHGRAAVTKASDVVLDWDEWDRFLEESFGRPVRGTYGLIAAYKLFDTPLPLPLFCRLRRIDQTILEQALEYRRMGEQTEPVAYDPENKLLGPKHDVIAELYFLFHRKTASINTLMHRVLDVLNDEETGILLDQIVDKQELLRGSAYEIDIDYRNYLDQIWQRVEAGEVQLTTRDRANLCLGRLWLDRKAWKAQAPTEGEVEALRDWLRDNAPAPAAKLTGRDLHGMSKLYVEWGIWERDTGNIEAAKLKFREALKIDPKSSKLRWQFDRLLDGDSARCEVMESVFREALELDPKHVPSLRGLGRLLAQDPARREEAEKVFLDALEIDPKNVPVFNELGRLLARDPARREEAEQVFQDALEIDPKNIPPRTELGRLLAEDPVRREEAEQVFRDALKIDPKNIPPRTELGHLLAQDPARREEAEQVFREALEIDPKNIPPRTELGRLLAQDPARREEAEQIFRDALEIDPKNVPVRTELGRLLAGYPARREEAEQIFREALEIDPKNVPVFNELGRLLAGDPARREEAEQVFRDAMEIDPKNVQVRTELGRLLARDPVRRGEAEKAFRAAIKLDSKDVPVRTELGRLLARDSTRWEEAEIVFRDALELDPKDVLVRTELGRLLAKQPHRQKEAETILKGIIDKKPRNIHSRDILAKMYVKQKRYFEAYQLYTEILNIKPSDKKAKEGLERLRQYIGESK